MVHNVNKATSLIHLIYSPLRARWIICCCVDGLQFPVCLQFDIEMITGTPSSTTGVDLNLPSELPDFILRWIFLDDLIRICHLQSFDKDPFMYSRVERFFRWYLVKQEHLMHEQISFLVFFYPISLHKYFFM